MSIIDEHSPRPGTQALFDDLPGGALIREGLADLVAGRVTAASLLVQIGRPRLLGLGLRVPDGPAHPRELYAGR
jgi:hypothetical protein